MISIDDTPREILKCAGCGRLTQRKRRPGLQCQGCLSMVWYVYTRDDVAHTGAKPKPPHKRPKS